VFYILVFIAGAMMVVYFIKKSFGSAFIQSLFLTERIKELGDKVKEGINNFLSDDK
jgi:hypothetical protein